MIQYIRFNIKYIHPIQSVFPHFNMLVSIKIKKKAYMHFVINVAVLPLEILSNSEQKSLYSTQKQL